MQGFLEGLKYDFLKDQNKAKSNVFQGGKRPFKVVTIATILETLNMELHGNGKTILIFRKHFMQIKVLKQINFVLVEDFKNIAVNYFS